MTNASASVKSMTIGEAVLWPLQHPALASLGWSLLILALFVPLAVRRYRTATAR